MVDVLYSFVDINQRFDQLVFDPFYIRNLNMTFMTMKSFYDQNVLFNHLTSNKILRQLLIEQIAHLKVDINDEPVEPSSETLAMMFALILSLCKQLIKLNFCIKIIADTSGTIDNTKKTA
ncbi:unnamed protein product [Rotaria magnacalcarata]